MGKIKKRGEAGAAKNYITRTQAVRKLQISLPDFRRLCIFKGIYPREPRNKKKTSKSSTQSTTFYYAKDIQYLLHEPLLAKFREQKTLDKKIARSLGRNEVHDAARLERYGKPKLSLDHIIRERYPTFIDALRDLDDALSLLFLFASLPATPTTPAKVISRCQRLCHEFEHYLISTNSLRKSFLSIKGIYYQATIQGQDIMWLVAYKFVQRVTSDVDYRIMGTFVDLYCTLLGFVNYRLYTSIGLVYPPKFDTIKDEQGGELTAFTIEGKQLSNADNSEVQTITNGHAQIENTEEVQRLIDSIAAQDQVNHQDEEKVIVTNGENEFGDDVLDEFEVAAEGGDMLAQPEISTNEASRLFANKVFFISREAPRHPIEFLLRAFGCKSVSWDVFLGGGSFTRDESDQRITHQVVDRPMTFEGENGEVSSARIYPGRIYVQPQWIWDSVNEGKLLRSDLYAPGATLPPHLSPWTKPMQGQYDPRATLEEQEAEGEAEEAAAVDDGDDDGSVATEDAEQHSEDDSEEIDDLDGGMRVAAGTDDEEDEGSEAESEDSFGGFEEDTVEEIETSGNRHQKEIEAEAAGQSYITLSKTNGQKAPERSEASKARAKQRRKEQEELERQKMMMSNKKRKLFEKMQYGNAKKEAEATKLRSKRRKLEKGKI